MKPPIFLRELSRKERQALEAGLRSKDAFVLRRSQMLLASARGQSPPKIAASLGCGSQTVYATRYPRVQRTRSRCPSCARLFPPEAHPHAAFGEGDSEALKELCCTALRGSLASRDEPLDAGGRRGGEFRGGPHRPASKRREDHPGDPGEAGSAPGAGQAVDREPRPRIREEKRALRRLLIRRAESDSEWVLGYEDETWWSRFEQPSSHSSWAEAGEPMRLLQEEAKKDDPDPKALSCYGLYLPEVGRSWLRFVDGRPVSAITTQFLRWSCQKLEAMGKKALLLIWENASWHKSKFVKEWLAAHNREEVKNGGHGVRIEYPALCPRRARGSTRSSPSGSTASARRSSPMWCSRLTSLRIGSVGSSAALMSLTYPFPKRSPDRALGRRWYP